MEYESSKYTEQNEHGLSTEHAGEIGCINIQLASGRLCARNLPHGRMMTMNKYVVVAREHECTGHAHSMPLSN